MICKSTMCARRLSGDEATRACRYWFDTLAGRGKGAAWTKQRLSFPVDVPGAFFRDGHVEPTARASVSERRLSPYAGRTFLTDESESTWPGDRCASHGMLAAACVCSLKCTAWIGVPSYPTGEGTGRPAGISRVREKRENPRSGEIDVVRRARQLEEQAVSVAHWPAEQSSPETESPSG